MAKLRISEIDYSIDGRLSMRISSTTEEDTLWFDLPPGVAKPHNDLIACAVAAIFDRTYDEYEFLSPVTDITRKRLESATRSTWNCPKSADQALPTGGRSTVLNFSGGFDSLAALALLGEDSSLVSLDFGGAFEREANFFKGFDTHSVSTNARLYEKSWTFMGIGAILLREHLHADYISFGNILEASPWHFVQRSGSLKTHPVFSAAGLEAFNPLLGLTEFATALIAAGEYPGLVLESLMSLAAPKSEKWLRKALLLKIVWNRLGSEPPGEPSFALEQQEVKPKLEWGSSFAGDFLAPGILMKSVEPATTSWMTKPAGFDAVFGSRNLDFYWRECPNARTNTPMGYAGHAAEVKNKYGITPYLASDWEDYHAVVNAMKVNHVFPGETF